MIGGGAEVSYAFAACGARACMRACMFMMREGNQCAKVVLQEKEGRSDQSLSDAAADAAAKGIFSYDENTQRALYPTCGGEGESDQKEKRHVLRHATSRNFIAPFTVKGGRVKVHRSEQILQ